MPKTFQKREFSPVSEQLNALLSAQCLVSPLNPPNRPPTQPFPCPYQDARATRGVILLPYAVMVRPCDRLYLGETTPTGQEKPVVVLSVRRGAIFTEVSVQ